ncbi:hypothetical protein [Croceitalea vernalis]|uniref:3-keto-disaccharide hydrolase domain-containing protein n=1 Tax=Croceitalea vernalis TaxID=3075599 RepID=A0ABU3BEZ1_9FLAO|nr:hypothetical protein [Croceitalea sp. P007]MDT0620727.1 hypothetical protein [Croceitalea sp. P007]
MKNKTLIATATVFVSLFTSKAQNNLDLSTDNLMVVNRDIGASEENIKSTLTLTNKMGDGMAILKNESFVTGAIDLDIKGENNPGKSFVGVAFNIQNDSTYEAIYFRPFNFKSDELIRREHSLQYISHPKNTWRYLRTNHEGIYEAEYANAPSPDDWFSIIIKITEDQVYVYDKKTNTELLHVNRLEKQVSDKIGLWSGFNSKGAYRNVKLLE